MGQYEYRARDHAGRLVTGHRDTDEPADLVRELSAQGLTEIRVELAAMAPRASVPEEELARQIGGMSRAGLPLEAGLRALEMDLPRGGMRQAVGDLAGRLERGESLDSALEAMKTQIPRSLQSLLQAGVQSERLGDVLTGFAEQSQVARDVKRTLWLGLIYPAVVVGLFFLLALLLCAILSGDFEKIYADFGIDLPALTLLILAVSRPIRDLGWWVVPLPFVVAGLVWLSARVLLNSRSRSSLVAMIPLVGGVERLSALGQFAHFLGLLIESQVPLGRSLELAGEATGDGEVAHASRQMSRRVESGESLAQAAVALQPVIPESLARVVSWAEPGGSYAPALHLAGEVFLAQARARASVSRVVFGTLVFATILIGVFLLVVGLFLPLVQLVSKLSG